MAHFFNHRPQAPRCTPPALSNEWRQAFALAYRFAHKGLPVGEMAKDQRRPTISEVRNSLENLKHPLAHRHPRGYLKGILWSAGFRETPHNDTDNIEIYYHDLFRHLFQGSRDHAPLQAHLAKGLNGEKEIGTDPFVLVGVLQAQQYIRQVNFNLGLEQRAEIADRGKISDFIRTLSYAGIDWNALKDITLVEEKRTPSRERTAKSLVGWRIPSGPRGINYTARIVAGK
jgi:hypothetical protein